MLAAYRERLHLQPMMSDCDIARSDGFDLDAKLMKRLNSWYGRLLLTGPLEWCPIDDVAAEVVLTRLDDDVMEARLPAHAVRPVEWKLEGWRRTVTYFPSPNEHAVLRHLNPWTRGNTCDPAVVNMGNRLTLYGAPRGADTTVAMARCVVRPVDGNFVFHYCAFDTLPCDWNF